MNSLIARLSPAVMSLVNEDGQDLVEYALLIALIAFACVAGMGTLASDINEAFRTVGTAVSLA